MKIGVIGATGKAGRMIAREAKNRGYEVTAIIRPGSKGRLEGDYPAIEKDITELMADDLKDFDVVVNAFGTSMSKPGSEYLHQTTMDHLIEVFLQLPKVRLMVVGGAGSLYTDHDRRRKVIEDIPADFRAVPENMQKAFEKLKTTDVNWTYLSPAKTFDPGGARTGKYILGTDYAIANNTGESYISYADYAVAMVDEMENKAFVRKRFTAVSNTLYYQDEKRLFNIGSTPFIRRGSWFGIYAAPMTGDAYGGAKVYLGTRHGAAANNPDNNLMSLFPTYNGKKVPYAVMTSATELTLQTRYGSIYFCFAEKTLMLVKGDKGMGLKLERLMITHEIVKKRGKDAWEAVFRWVCSMVFKPLKGRIEMDAPWEWEELTTPRVKMHVLPDSAEEGFVCAVEEFTHSGWVRDSYPTYDQALEDVTAEWQGFLANFPHYIEPLEEKRKEVAYLLWSHLVSASGQIKRPFMYMTGTGCASEWQMCQNAVALHRDMDLVMDLLLNMFDHISPVGQLPDLYDDMRGIFQLIKPPLQGWALKHIMERHDLSREAPRDKLGQLYDGCTKWANWFMIYRDDDHDGIPQYEHGDETGFDDTTVFKVNPVMETPDLCAYLGLLFEAMGDLSKILGKDKDETDRWYARSKEIIQKMIDAMWNGERFIAHVSGTHEVVATDSFLYYLPIVLGKRLPQEIIDRLAADLSVEGDLLTPYGLTCEKMSTSGDFDITRAMAKGSIIPPTNLLITTGLYDAGKTKLAKLIAKRYCTAMKDGGIAFMMNPFYGSRGGFGGSWPACAYAVLAELCSKED